MDHTQPPPYATTDVSKEKNTYSNNPLVVVIVIILPVSRHGRVPRR